MTTRTPRRRSLRRSLLSRHPFFWRRLSGVPSSGLPRPRFSLPGLPLSLLAAALMAAQGPAFARNDEPPGLARKHAQPAVQTAPAAPPGAQVDLRIGAVFTDQHREAVQQYYGQQVQRAGRCPPGLARKNNGCLPPGQARKFRVGQPLPPDVVWYAVPPAVAVRLPVVPPGYRYARVGADIVLLGPGAGVVIDVMLAFPL